MGKYIDGIALTTIISHIGHQDEGVPKEGDLQNVPLHSNDDAGPLQVFKSTPKQLLATVASLMHKEEKVVHQSGGVYVGKGLPPVPVKLAKKILSGDYMEMEELLPEVGTLEDNPPEPKCCCLRRVSDIFTWLHAMCLLLETFEHLGLPIVWDKLEGPSPCLTFLGFELHSIHGKIRLP